MSKFTLDVIVNGKAVRKYFHYNDVYIEGRKGSEYELKFTNSSSGRVKVIFSVDGLSVTDGKTASDKSQGYIVNAWSSVVVPGWTLSNSKVAKFEFNPQGDKYNTTYVESLEKAGFDVDPENQGIIGVMVFEEKYEPIRSPYPIQYDPYAYVSSNLVWGYSKPPSIRGASDFVGYAQAQAYSDNYQPVATAAATVNGITRSSRGMNSMTTMDCLSFEEANLGTGMGEDQAFYTTNVEFKNATKKPAFVDTINYDTKTNLRRKGVIISDDYVKQAFPGYREDYCVDTRKRKGSDPFFRKIYQRNTHRIKKKLQTEKKYEIEY